jgi:ubiquinone/menaquinone biosynthesis C-methylase UbiE
MRTQDRHWQQRPEGFAAFYEGPSALSPAGIVSRFLDARTAALEALVDCRPEHRLLDVGCGSGPHMVRYLDRCAHVAGVDYSEAMVDLARRALEGSGRTNWELRRADAAALPFPDGSFDVVIAMGLLDYVPSAADVLREFRRVLKPGGQAVVTIPKSPSIFSPLRSSLGNLVKRHVFDLPPVGNIQSRASLRTLVEDAGFRLEAARPVWTAMWMAKAVREA